MSVCGYYSCCRTKVPSFCSSAISGHVFSLSVMHLDNFRLINTGPFVCTFQVRHSHGNWLFSKKWLPEKSSTWQNSYLRSSVIPPEYVANTFQYCWTCPPLEGLILLQLCECNCPHIFTNYAFCHGSNKDWRQQRRREHRLRACVIRCDHRWIRIILHPCYDGHGHRPWQKSQHMCLLRYSTPQFWRNRTSFGSHPSAPIFFSTALKDNLMFSGFVERERRRRQVG